MNSLVSYPERGIGGNSSYRGNCSPLLIEDLIKQYKLESISDYACGSNTTFDAASRLGIKSKTTDLSMGFDLIDSEITDINDFIFYHPAYWDIIKYSGNMYGDKPFKNDISRIADYKEFMEALNYTVMKQYASLRQGGRMAILMGDIKRKGKLYSMILDIIKLGTIENIVIKAQHNTVSGRKTYSNNNFIPIVHEYLLILRRDSAYIDTLKVTNDIVFDIRDSTILSWKDVVFAVISKAKKPLTLNEIYDALKYHRKAQMNEHYKEKIRQTLSVNDTVFKRVDKGVYFLAA